MTQICRIVKFLVVPLISIIVATDSVLLQSTGAAYRGKYLGPLTSRKHSVSGHVYAVDSRTLHLQGFNYDGTGPDAFFWVGFTESPSPQGIIVPNERGTKEVLTAYHNADITISLPDGLTLRDIKWFAVWCRAYEVNFGDLYIPANLDYPQPHVIGSIVGQGISSGPIVVVDAQTILVPDFTFDGQAPDLHFWVGRGSPGPDGIRIADETGGDAGLAKADKKTLVLNLPGDLTIFDIDYFGVYSRSYNIDYGHVRIQPGLNVPPSLRMLGISPQTRLNCEVLHDESALEIRWSVVGSGETIVFQLVGRIDDGNYMAFGLSGENDRSVMLGGDVAVGWLDQFTGRGHVTDYYLERKSMCVGNAGACPDVHWKEGTNNVRMLSAASVNGFTILTYQRKLGAADIYDKPILTNGSQPVIWAVGPINNGEAQYHFLRNKDDLSIDFGRVPKWNCPEPEAEPESTPNSPSPASILLQSTQTAAAASSHHGTSNINHVGETSTAATTTTTFSITTTSVLSAPTTTTTTPRPTPASRLTPHPSVSSPAGEASNIPEHKVPATAPSPAAWSIPPIPCYEPDDRVYYAQLGPTGGTYGYRSITGRQDKPQEAWYINGLLLPELYLVRNLNYTFVIQGGDNPDAPADYNPFYITDDPEGGHDANSFIERQGVKVYAGVEVDSRGRNIPTAVGKLCRWMENGNQPADFFTSYAAYQRSLFLNCDKGHSGILNFTPDRNTPNLIYYQSYTKRHLGWKIHVVDDCEVPSESRHEPVLPQQQQPPHQPVKADSDTPMLHQQQHLTLAQIQQQLQHHHHHQQQQQQQGSLHLNEQSRNSDQSPGEAVNHQSVVAPLLPNGDSKAILSGSPGVPSLSPVSGLGSGRPVENPYLFTSASSPAAAPGIGLPSLGNLQNVHISPMQHPHQQQQQQQLPSIISLDANRLLINAKPVDANGVPVSHGITQYAPLQGQTVVSMPAQPDGFHFSPHNTAFFQVTMDGSAAGAGGMGSDGITGNRIQSGAFPQTTFQLAAGPLPEGHLMRRTGPQSPIIHHHHHHQQQQQASPSQASLNSIKFSKVGDRSEIVHPDFFVGANRAPFVSQAMRYEGIPIPSILYQTTGSPVPGRVNNNNNPISFLATQQGDKPHHQFPELATGGQNALLRFPGSRLRADIVSPTIVGASTDNLKYVEVPAAHNIHVLQHAHHGSDGGTRLVASWTQARNLPKREQRHPFLPEQPYSVHLGKGRMRATLRSGVLHGIRANDNLHEARKMDVPKNSPQQSSAQRSGPLAQGPQPELAKLREGNKGLNIHVNGAEGLLQTSTVPTTTILPSKECSKTDKSSTCVLHSSDSSGSNTAHDDTQNPQLSLQEQQKPLVSPEMSAISTTSKEHGEISTTSPISTTLSQSSARGSDNHPPTTELSKVSNQRKLQVEPRPWKVESPSSKPTGAPSSFRIRIIPIELASGAIRSTSTNINTTNNNNDDDYEVDDDDGHHLQEMMKKSKRRKKKKPTNLTFMGSSFAGGNTTSGTGSATSPFSTTVTTSTTESYSPKMHTTTSVSGYINKKVEPSSLPSSSSTSTGTSSSTTQGPVFESFSPVFRPSPVDLDGFNVSTNFRHNHHQKTQQLQRQHQGFGRNIATDDGFPTPGLHSSTTAHQSKLSISSSSQGHHFTSGKRKFRHPQLLVNFGGPYATSQSQQKEKALAFTPPPSAAAAVSSSSITLNRNNELSASTTSSTTSVGGGKNPLHFFPNERNPAGYFPPLTRFHDPTKLFNFHRQRQYHLHHPPPHYPYSLMLQPPAEHRHPPFPLLPLPSRPRFPPFSPSAPSFLSNGPSNSHNHRRMSSDYNAPAAILSPAKNTPPSIAGHKSNKNGGIINPRKDVLAVHSSTSPVITIISTPRSAVDGATSSANSGLSPVSNQEASDMLMSKTQFHLLEDDNEDDVNENDSRSVHRKQIIKSRKSGSGTGSWAHLSSMMGGGAESISETVEPLQAPVLASTSSSATDREAAASSSLENLIKIGKLGTTNSQSTLLHRGGNKVGWRRRSTTTSSTTTTTTSTTPLMELLNGRKEEEGDAEDEGKEGGIAKDDHKAGDGEEEGGSPDPLSLTLLTDIWQTINQDNGSKTPSLKPAVTQPPTIPRPPAGIAPVQVHPHRYNFQREHQQALHSASSGSNLNRQIPPRILNGGGIHRSRAGSPPPLLYPIRRQPSMVPHPHFGQRTFRNGRDRLPA